MSVIFGICNPHGGTTEREVHRLAAATARFAPDGASFTVQGRVGMGFQRYWTHERSRMESQPFIDEHGNMLSFDGRLDNWDELRRSLDLTSCTSADSSVVLAAFARWGENCFSKLVGDWALALWAAHDQALYLARDHAGSRTLFYEQSNGRIRWSTYLETFFAEGITHRLNRQYAARYLAALPIRALTPYQGIEGVPPAHYLVIREQGITVKPHWKWMAADPIRYNADVEYDEHFLSLFQNSVARRTGPDCGILAQLSGGMDSVSILCMSDSLRRSRGASVDDLLDTVSFYDDTEPNWNERPYFSVVEAKRQKTGLHVDISLVSPLCTPLDPAKGTPRYPGGSSETIEREQKLGRLSATRGYRAILSGIGGDEVLGGVPTPLPELADYMVSGNVATLLRRGIEWSTAGRTTLFHLLFETARFATHLYRPPSHEGDITPWIPHCVRSMLSETSRREPGSRSYIGLSPSAISNGLTWWTLLETLPHLRPSSMWRHEHRYPYLDRDLIDFLFRVPRNQLIQPGRRRTMMRRALRAIVPIEILERRRKAFVIRAPLVSIQREQDQIKALFAASVSADYGLIDPAALRLALDAITRTGDVRWLLPLMRAISFELWLRAKPWSMAHHLAAT